MYEILNFKHFFFVLNCTMLLKEQNRQCQVFFYNNVYNIKNYYYYYFLVHRSVLVTGCGQIFVMFRIVLSGRATIVEDQLGKSHKSEISYRVIS